MYKLIRNIEELSTIKLDLNKHVFCDTETAKDLGLSDGGLYGKVRLFQFFQDGWDEAVIVDCMFVPLADVLAFVKDYKLVFHNASYDLHTVNLYTPETWWPKQVDDTLYLSRLTFFDKQKFDFYECLAYAGESDYIIDAIDKKENQTHDWNLPLTEKLLIYAAVDVIYLAKLWPHVNDSVSSYVYELDINNLKYAINYGRHGIPINRNTIKRIRLEQMEKAEAAYKLLPSDLNVNSSPQVCSYIGCKAADATTLGILAMKGDDRAQVVINAKKATKALSYIMKYDRDLMKGFHNPCGAVTGRMACNGGDRYDHENLQQPPRLLFPAFEAPEGKNIIYKDYSGLELRFAVAYVGEPRMSDMMKAGLDLHTHTGCKLFNCTPETLSFTNRTITKFYNFGTIYGAGVATLQNLLQSQGRIDLPFKEVAALKAKWLDLYSYFSEWHNMHKEQLRIYGYIDITTAFGRVIRTYTLTDSLNFPIQGSCVEATKLAVHLLCTRYPEVYIINVVHDSISLLQDEDDSQLWVDRLNECMIESWYAVIASTAIPDLPMPAEAKAYKIWPHK